MPAQHLQLLMPPEDRPSKGTSALTEWLRRPSARQQFWGEPINQTSPIFQLPNEIFIIVFSYFPTLQLEHAYYRIDAPFTYAWHFIHRYRARHRVLLTFTQLCRSMRRKFLPWLWEHIQFSCVHLPGPRGLEYLQSAETVFRRQSKALVATPSLAAHVKTLSVYILPSNASGLVKLLRLLPNLDTLEVNAERYEDPSIKRSFKSIQLPQIRMLVTGPQAHHLMRCCTDVKRALICHRGSHVTGLEINPFTTNSLVHLALYIPAPRDIEDWARLYPNLEELGILQPQWFQTLDCITAVQSFRKLRLLEIVVSPRIDLTPPSPWPVLESRIKELAITVLGNIHGHTKVLKVISLGDLSGWENIRDLKTQIITVP